MLLVYNIQIYNHSKQIIYCWPYAIAHAHFLPSSMYEIVAHSTPQTNPLLLLFSICVAILAISQFIGILHHCDSSSGPPPPFFQKLVKAALNGDKFNNTWLNVWTAHGFKDKGWKDPTHNPQLKFPSPPPLQATRALNSSICHLCTYMCIIVKLLLFHLAWPMGRSPTWLHRYLKTIIVYEAHVCGSGHPIDQFYYSPTIIHFVERFLVGRSINIILYYVLLLQSDQYYVSERLGA